MATLVYARVSSTDQNEDRQIAAMNEFAIPTEPIDIDKFALFPDSKNTIYKKINNTTYIVTAGFNGDTRWDMASALVRLASLEASGSYSVKNAEIR